MPEDTIPTTDPESSPSTPTDSDKDKNFRALEEARKRDQERANRLLESSITALAKSVGVDASKGVGKLLVKEYKGSLGDELPTEEHFKSFLEQNEYEVGKQQSQQEKDMNTLQSQADQLRASTTQPQPPGDLDDLIKQTEAAAWKGEANWADVMDLKLRKQLQG